MTASLLTQSFLFKKILGQEQAKRLLWNALKNKRIAPAYIFYGPEGVGRRLAARFFAAALNCAELGCGVCPSCHKILNDQHPDVSFIYPEVKDIKIENVREIQRMMSLKLYEGKWRIVVLDPADSLNETSSNCLLKILEEPPAFSSIILISRNPYNLLPTIQSRAQDVAFYPVSLLQIEQTLREEGFEQEQAHFLSRASLGCFGRLEGLKSAKGKENREQILKILTAVSQSSVKKVLQYSEKLVLASREQGREYLLEVFDFLVLWYRDLLWIKSQGCEEGLFYPVEKKELMQQAQRLSLKDIQSGLIWLLEAVGLLKHNAHAELTLVATFLRLMGGFGTKEISL